MKILFEMILSTFVLKVSSHIQMVWHYWTFHVYEPVDRGIVINQGHTSWFVNIDLCVSPELGIIHDWRGFDYCHESFQSSSVTYSLPYIICKRSVHSDYRSQMGRGVSGMSLVCWVHPHTLVRPLNKVPSLSNAEIECKELVNSFSFSFLLCRKYISTQSVLSTLRMYCIDTPRKKWCRFWDMQEDDLKVALYVCPNHIDNDIHSDHSYIDIPGIP